MEKKFALHTTTPMHEIYLELTKDVLFNIYKLPSSNQGNSSELTFVVQITKINFKNLET